MESSSIRSIDIFPCEEAHQISSGARLILSYMLILLFFLPSLVSAAQDSTLTIENAVTLALEKNFDVQISRNISKMLDNRDHIGEAGMLPDLSVNGSYSHADNTTKQLYSNGEVVDRTGAINENLNADLSLDWTIFDGFKMFSSKRKLSALSEQGKYELKIQMEDIILQVTRSYYEITRQQQLLKSIREEIVYAREQVLLAERRFSNGSGAKLDLLHIKTNLNAKLSAEQKQKSVLKDAKIELNRLIGNSPDNEFIVSDTVEIKFRPSLDDLKKNSLAKNSIRSYRIQQILISEYSLKEKVADRWPEIKLNGSYAYSDSKNDAGFIRQNKNQGLNYGITATLPLFGGFNRSTQIKNARLELLNARLQLENSNQVLSAEVLSAFEKFMNLLEILKLEEENIIAAKEILAISQQRFKTGSSDILELKEAQRNFEESMYRLVNVRFEAKYAETYLKQLSGELIK
ncbi:MAG TPA: TolC family protein [Bacteroidia bacterium]|nr:TolC family protein [Bacteroidia bacterium]